jgi:hypothetical protein
MNDARHRRRAYPLRGLRSPVVVRLEYGEHSNVPRQLAPAVESREALTWVRYAIYGGAYVTARGPQTRACDFGVNALLYRLSIAPPANLSMNAQNLQRVRALLAVLVGLPACLWDSRPLGESIVRAHLSNLMQHEQGAPCNVARFVLDRFPASECAP